jgi:hypothetical protein
MDAQEAVNGEKLRDEDLRVLHAAMTSMVEGIHACQDTLSEEEWERAEEIWNELNEEMNGRNGI